MSVPSAPSDLTGRARRHPGLGLMVRILLALALSFAVVIPFAHWALEWRMVEYLISWLLMPSSGFLPLALVFWLLLTVPGLLLRWSGDSLAPGSGSVPASAGEGLVEIPSGTFRELGVEHRYEMAQALDVPWRDELIHDHQSWAAECLEAAQRRASALR